jgi:phosphatidate cytidylyltransferase
MKQRIVTGVIAGSIFLVAVALGGYWYTGLILALAFVGQQEFMRLNTIPVTSFTSISSLLATLALVFPWEHFFEVHLPTTGIIWVLMALLLSATVVTKNRVTLDHAALSFIGTIYVGFGFRYMIDARLEHGLFWTIFVFVLIWVSDSGAYFSGRAFGRTKLWPSISPNKTVEGAIGGTVLTVGVAVAFVVFGHEAMSIWKAAAIGLLVAISGMFGDLIQSAYKRIRDIKDSGTLLPGHGGVLDRCDSWIIVFPIIGLLGLLP